MQARIEGCVVEGGAVDARLGGEDAEDLHVAPCLCRAAGYARGCIQVQDPPSARGGQSKKSYFFRAGHATNFVDFASTMTQECNRASGTRK